MVDKKTDTKIRASDVTDFINKSPSKLTERQGEKLKKYRQYSLPENIRDNVELQKAVLRDVVSMLIERDGRKLTGTLLQEISEKHNVLGPKAKKTDKKFVRNMAILNGLHPMTKAGPNDDHAISTSNIVKMAKKLGVSVPKGFSSESHVPTSNKKKKVKAA